LPITVLATIEFRLVDEICNVWQRLVAANVAPAARSSPLSAGLLDGVRRPCRPVLSGQVAEDQDPRAGDAGLGL